MCKKLFFIIFYSFSTIYAYSQIDSTSILYAKKFESDVFVELGSNIIQVNNGAGMDFNLALNYLINNKYYVAAAYSQLASNEITKSTLKISNQPIELEDFDTKIKYQTAGLRFGYILFEDHKIISFSPDLTASWMFINLKTEEVNNKLNGVQITPALKGVFNISDYFRIGLQLNYKASIFKDYDSSTDVSTNLNTKLSSKSLSGVGGGVFLRIGNF